MSQISSSVKRQPVDRWICAVDGNVSYPGLFTNDHWSIGILIADPDRGGRFRPGRSEDGYVRIGARG